MEEHVLKNIPLLQRLARPRAGAPARRPSFAPAAVAGIPLLLALAACSTVDVATLPPTAAGGAGAMAAGTLAPTATPGATTSDAATAADAAKVDVVNALAAAASAPDARPTADADAQDPDDADTGAAVLPPYDPLQPEAKVDLADTAAHQDLWGRLRAGFVLPDLDTPDVKEWEQWYASRPDYVARMTARGSRYLYHITEEVEKRHMPSELALLPFTESAYNPQAMSTAAASGMWQFIASTGKDYDLTQNIFRDDRRNVLASTQAALDYLQKLHDMFGDWQLALAAYNCGEGTVQRAIERNRRRGQPTDYLSLNLPAETRGYVPKLQAVKNIVQHPDAYGLALPALENHPYFLTVPIERDIDVALAAKLAGISLDEFKALNPQLNKPVILAAGTPQVLLPYDNADDFVKALGTHNGPLASWTAWVATKTLRPADAAKQVGMSEAELREVNHIPPRMLVKAGSTLLVPRSATHTNDVSEKIAETALMALAPDLPPTRRVNVRVGRGGETVASLARRMHVGAGEVASWNHVSPNGKFGPGATAVVFVPRATAMARAPSHAPAKGAAAHTPATRTASAHGAKPASRTVAHAAAPASHKPVAKVASKSGGTTAHHSTKTSARVAQQ
jgi:membrane-bound lytic murein transglycosylase D